jgi:hypothetical protein
MSKSFMLIALLFPLLAVAVPELPLHDPTKPAIFPEAPTTGTIKPAKVGQAPIKTFNLQAIMIQNSRRIALINDKFTREGDIVDGAKILSIDNNTVILLYEGQKIQLYLFETGMRK